MIASQLGQLDATAVGRGKGKKLFTIMMAVMSLIGLTRLLKLLQQWRGVDPEIAMEKAAVAAEREAAAPEAAPAATTRDAEERRLKQSRQVANKGMEI